MNKCLKRVFHIEKTCIGKKERLVTKMLKTELVSHLVSELVSH
nr:MAG TPA: hypothetical protein [Caudoviricetes sp.]